MGKECCVPGRRDIYNALDIIKERAERATLGGDSYCCSGKRGDDRFSRKANEVISILDSGVLGGQAHIATLQTLRDVLEEVMGEPLPRLTTRRAAGNPPGPYPKYTVVVPEANPNGHNYPIGLPCMLVERAVALHMGAAAGNNLPSDRRTVVKATQEQIDDLFEALHKSARRDSYRLWQIIDRYHLIDR